MNQLQDELSQAILRNIRRKLLPTNQQRNTLLIRMKTRTGKLMAILCMNIMVISCTGRIQPPPEQQVVYRYISETIGETVREAYCDSAGNFALPRPYSVPCIRGGFQNMFYWDTYFTNAGLLELGDTVQARNNIENIAAMVEKLGYMPNATCSDLSNRSQPPLFSQMVADYYNITGDILFLQQMYPILEREYNFWVTQRVAPNGLNRYGHNATEQYLIDFWRGLAHRIGKDGALSSDSNAVVAGAHLLAEAESGWDFNIRFDDRCMDFNPVDLNAIMYGFEKNMNAFSGLLGKNSDIWNQRAEARKILMNRFMLDPVTGLFFDYDFTNDHRSPVFSAAVFTLLWNEVLTSAQAEILLANMERLETPFGILTCEPGIRRILLQWDAPNGWAPIHFYVIKGLDNYGFKEGANRIARKYLNSIINIYNSTGQLWEKFNAVKGNSEVNDEYPMPGQFMGWTAGTYVLAYKYAYNL